MQSAGDDGFVEPRAQPDETGTVAPAASAARIGTAGAAAQAEVGSLRRRESMAERLERLRVEREREELAYRARI